MQTHTDQSVLLVLGHVKCECYLLHALQKIAGEAFITKFNTSGQVSLAPCLCRRRRVGSSCWTTKDGSSAPLFTAVHSAAELLRSR